MQEIKQFDVLVHPDFHLRHGGFPLTLSDIERRKKWDARVMELAEDPQTLMLYFCAFLQLGNRTDCSYKVRGVDDLKYRYELQRIIRYREQLGKRFILFASDQSPSKKELEKIFSERGFFYNSESVLLAAYGEYGISCVSTWKRRLAFALGLQKEHSHILKQLILPGERVLA